MAKNLIRLAVDIVSALQGGMLPGRMPMRGAVEGAPPRVRRWNPKPLPFR